MMRNSSCSRFSPVRLQLSEQKGSRIYPLVITKIQFNHVGDDGRQGRTTCRRSDDARGPAATLLAQTSVKLRRYIRYYSGDCLASAARPKVRDELMQLLYDQVGFSKRY